MICSACNNTTFYPTYLSWSFGRLRVLNEPAIKCKVCSHAEFNQNDKNHQVYTYAKDISTILKEYLEIDYEVLFNMWLRGEQPSSIRQILNA